MDGSIRCEAVGDIARTLELDEQMNMSLVGILCDTLTYIHTAHTDRDGERERVTRVSFVFHTPFSAVKYSIFYIFKSTFLTYPFRFVTVASAAVVAFTSAAAASASSID